MKRILLLTAAAALICGTASAQFAQKSLVSQKLAGDNKSQIVKQKPNNQRDDNAVWSCDFEEGSPVPTLTKTDDSQVIWNIITESDYPDEMYTSSGGCYFLPMNYTGHPGNNDPHQQISETPEHWAFVDAGSDRYSSAPQINTSMTFSNIDLSTCAKPKVTFLQSWKELNSTKESISVETSIDGGSSWTSHIINDEDIDSYTYVNGYKEVLIPEAGGASNVAIRFTYTSESGTWNYGWQIDDIKIIPIPANNLTIQNARISMFGYVDYTDAEYLAEVWPNMEAEDGLTVEETRAKRAYQINDPYAVTPIDQWASANGIAAFNVEVINNGYETVTPKAKIKITSPSNVVVYEKTVAGRSLALSAKDTIDFDALDAETMEETAYFFFNEDPELGRYNVEFTVFADGATDEAAEDNTTVQYFYVSDKNYSTAYEEPTARTKVNSYISSASGDEYGTEFTYYFQPDDVMSVDVYIARGTSIGATAIQARLYEYDSENSVWANKRSSETKNITENMIDTWTNLVFDDPYEVRIAEEERSTTVLIAIKYIFDSGDAIYIGSNNVFPNFGHNSIGRAAGEENWYYGYSQMAINFHPGEMTFPGREEEGSVQSFSMVDVEMYPNPTNGTVNFTNVENATIEIYNMMGQVVASIENATDNATIDLSTVANGNYVVRIVKNGAVATSKLNIVK